MCQVRCVKCDYKLPSAACLSLCIQRCVKAHRVAPRHQFLQDYCWRSPPPPPPALTICLEQQQILKDFGTLTHWGDPPSRSNGCRVATRRRSLPSARLLWCSQLPVLLLAAGRSVPAPRQLPGSAKIQALASATDTPQKAGRQKQPLPSSPGPPREGMLTGAARGAKSLTNPTRQ